MIIKKLDNAFYNENKHLVEVLDKDKGVWTANKTRGYGIVLIQLNGLRFGIPLRSNLKHKASFITKKTALSSKGLDFSKAVLLDEDHYISDDLFKIPQDEYKKLNEKKHYIENRFSKYVERYIKASKSDDNNVLNSYEYRFTTLKNYHQELGIKL